MRRPPAVAGRFYPAKSDALALEVAGFLKGESTVPKMRAVSAICPHAGYMYSGGVAGHVYSRIEIPERIIILGPNHTGHGPGFAVMDSGEWEIPTGRVPVDTQLAQTMLREMPALTSDETAHRMEHSIEVQLPFIRHLRADARIVPVAVKQSPLRALKEAGAGLARAVQSEEVSGDVLIIVSSDMSHYLPEAEAKEKDFMALEKILALDPEGLFDIVHSQNITMCGYAPAVMMLYATNALGAGEATLLKYTTSAEASGDYSHVVGYAGVAIR